MLIAISYVTYANANFQENYVLIALEYAIVLAVMCYEIMRKKPLLQHF